ncbi:THAP domain-containing protein 5 isoform X2 [Mastacembelus armatus]|uniref:THAP domain-containing protein 5 isoform X2 n=1 Tax=Mastacembelus armatus TaxID=205130 RepID=UPI000E465114|nr:THAP domain-containing protein 5 isoform X2 [Mastacembelus armatus]
MLRKFPLHDEPRLQKWMGNIKQGEWTPSRHQYVCSEHFTEDCFDIRWGIRYLKNTAIPTLFLSTEHDGGKKVSVIKRNPKAKPRTADEDAEPTVSDSTLSKRPLILSRACKQPQSSTTNTAAEHTQIIFESPVVSSAGISAIKTVACEVPGDSGMTAASCLTPSAYIKSHSVDEIGSTVTALCCESGLPSPDAEGSGIGVGLQAALDQTFGFVPVEMIKDKSLDCFSEEKEPSEGEHIFAYEHSYCRPDTDKDQLWSKILSLHAKIMELDRREASTVAKIHALEAEIALLKRDGAAFKEKQKALENYISSMFV